MLRGVAPCVRWSMMGLSGSGRLAAELRLRVSKGPHDTAPYTDLEVHVLSPLQGSLSPRAMPGARRLAPGYSLRAPSGLVMALV